MKSTVIISLMDVETTENTWLPNTAEGWKVRISPRFEMLSDLA
jgi:hypothetical protein